MRQAIIPLVISVLCLTACKAPQKASLETILKDHMAKGQGIFALSYLHLDTGEEIHINEKERFHAASTMKTPVLIELYKQAAEGKFAMDDSVMVKNEFYSIVDSTVYSMDIDEDSEEKLYEQIGSKLPIQELAYDMIVASSNLATNILIDLVDAKKVTQTMRGLGADSIDVLRGVEDMKAYRAGLSNSTCSMDLMKIMEAIATDQAGSTSDCQAMIKILRDQKWRDVIPRYLPADVTVANKTGNITGVHHDSGIVYLPDGQSYVLVLLSKELEDFDRGTELLARASEMVYKHHLD